MGLQVRPARRRFYPAGNETPMTSRDRIQHHHGRHRSLAPSFSRAETPSEPLAPLCKPLLRPSVLAVGPGGAAPRRSSRGRHGSWTSSLHRIRLGMEGLAHPRPLAVPCLAGAPPRHDCLDLKPIFTLFHASPRLASGQIGSIGLGPFVRSIPAVPPESSARRSCAKFPCIAPDAALRCCLAAVPLRTLLRSNDFLSKETTCAAELPEKTPFKTI
ncbi:uncharacterized protein LOC119297010 [Triticum dicoccoides]|uniref:uncharacterized protein LOC119297010 n=1 Tax=Triticum dicoccoides TaxID=85692 RepID=UPI0018909241|nr:uncharacterized protein LOC119297010 [Triticum dicoccoides]